MFAGHLGELELVGASIASVGIQGLAYGIMVIIFIFHEILKIFICFYIYLCLENEPHLMIRKIKSIYISIPIMNHFG